MGRSRSRSRSSSYSSSEDEEERKEREALEEEKRALRAFEREQRAAAKKQKRLGQDAIEKAGAQLWTFSIPAADGVVEEDPFTLSIRAVKPPHAPASVVDTQDWAALEGWVRAQFEVPDAVKKIKLKVRLELDGEAKLFGSARDPTTLFTAHDSIIRMGQLLLDATEVKVNVSIVAADIGKKLKAPSKLRTREQV